MKLRNSPGLQVNHLDAREAASAVFCTVARRLSYGEDVRLVRAFGGITGSLGACDIHQGPSHARRMSRDELLVDMADHQRIPVDKSFRVVTAVFTAIRDRLPVDEVAAVASRLPADLADLLRRPV